MLFRSFSAGLHAVVNPDNVKASVRLYICGSDVNVNIAQYFARISSRSYKTNRISLMLQTSRMLTDAPNGKTMH